MNAMIVDYPTVVSDRKASDLIPYEVTKTAAVVSDRNASDSIQYEVTKTAALIAILPGSFTSSNNLRPQPLQVQNENPISLYLGQVRTLRRRSREMNIPQPDNNAINSVTEILIKLNEIGLIPTRLSPSAEGGIAVGFRNAQRFADIEVLNTGEISALTSDGQGNIEAWDFDPSAVKQTLEKIRSYTGL
jgi:hypothetical protein